MKEKWQSCGERFSWHPHRHVTQPYGTAVFERDFGIGPDRFSAPFFLPVLSILKSDLCSATEVGLHSHSSSSNFHHGGREYDFVAGLD